MAIIRYYILLLIKENHKSPVKAYDEISNEARAAIDDYPNKGSIEGVDRNNHEAWYTKTIKMCGNQIIQIIIKHYKMRIILEVEKEFPENNLADLFSKAREMRKGIDEITNIEQFIKNLKTRCPHSHIADVFRYDLIEVLKEYKSKDFRRLKQEPLTTFFYEVPDYRRERKLMSRIIGKVIPLSVPKTIIRTSRPSIITSRMSDYMRMEVINIIYDTCLYQQRKTGKHDITDDTFWKMKNYLGKTLFDIESTHANINISMSLNLLSIIMSIGAIASILAIMAFIPHIIVQDAMPYYKALCAVVLAVWALMIFITAILKQ